MALQISNVAPTGLLNQKVRPASGSGALNNPNYSFPTQQAGGFIVPKTTPFSSTQKPVVAPMPSSDPNIGAVKSHTVNADGSTKTEYHNPDQTPKPVPPTPTVAQTSSGQPPQPFGANVPPVPTGAPGTPPAGNPTQTQGTLNQGGTTPTGIIVNPDGSLVPNSGTLGQQTTFPGLLNSAVGAAGANIPIGQQAQQIAAQYGQRIADVGQQGARAQAGYLTTGTTPVAEGNAAIQAQTTAAQQQALATGEEAALQGTGQQLTAQQQQQTGLLGAAGLAQPQAGAAFFGSPVTGGVVQPQPQQYTIKPGDTFFSLAGGDQSKIAAIEQANPGVDPNNLQPGQQINLPSTGTSGPFTAGIIAGQQQAGQNIATMQTALGAARGVAQTLQTELQQNPSLNSNSLAAANALQQWMQGKVAPNSPYINFLNDLQEYANTIAPVLGIGGNVTDLKTGIANQMIPTLASGGTIVDALNNLDKLAVSKINEASKAAQSVGQTSTPSPISGGSQAPASGGVKTPYGTINPNL